MMNQKMKKTIATMCMGAAVLTLTPAVSWAETAVNPLNNLQESSISPYMLYIKDSTCNLNISGSTATVNCSVEGDIDSATKAKVIAELQVKNGSSWIPVKIWTVEENDYMAKVKESHTINTSNTYRVKATVTVWEGSQSETQTLYSE
ncbi:MAG: hypothetical protein IJB37_06285 [Peptococcaceae bacterium]|nr:hypothetical protein [Peptococcaceae bacterium]